MSTSAAAAKHPETSPMHFTIERAALLKSLGHVQSVVEKRGTIPVLSHVKIEARGDQVAMTATDMDIALIEHVAAEVKTPGTATVPAHMFYDIARKLPEGAQIELQVKDSGKITIKSGSSRFALASLPVSEFPVMSEGDLPHSFTLSTAEIQALVTKPAYAISTEETRYYLNGISFHTAGNDDGKVLRAVATDGHRLARIEVAMPAGAGGMPSIIIPRKTIFELQKLLAEATGDVQIALSDNKIRFSCSNATLISKLIDGNFPDYERVIPSGNDKVMEVDCKAFTQGVDRVSIIASEKTRAVKLAITSGKLTLSAHSAEQGNASEEIAVKYSADPIEIGFNSRYVLEMMSNIEGESAQFVLADGASPVIVRDTSDVGALYVIMPMRV